RAQGSHIRCEIAELAMRKPKRIRGFASAPGWIVENVTIGHRHKQLFIIRACAPTERRPRQVRQVADRQWLWMPAVPPIRVQIAERSMLPPGLGRLLQIYEGVVVPADQRHPRRGAGTNIKRDPGTREDSGFALEGMVCVVTPV